MSMHQILADIAAAIAGVLERELPQVGKDWWQSCVVDRLSIQQQRLVSDRRVDSLAGLDLGNGGRPNPIRAALPPRDPLASLEHRVSARRSLIDDRGLCGAAVLAEQFQRGRHGVAAI